MILRLTLRLVILVTVLASSARSAPPVQGLREASGVTRRGKFLLFVDDQAPGVYFRFRLPRNPGSLIPIEPGRLRRIRLPGANLALDPEAIDVLADGRVVILSERLRALVDARGIVADYDPTFTEFGGRGLEGLAVRDLGNGASRVAVLWEGGYPEYSRVPIQLQGKVGRVALRPILLVHDISRGQSGKKIHRQDALQILELEVPLPEGAEPQAQRFRTPDLVWHERQNSGNAAWGFIAILSSMNSVETRVFQYHWLQRFDMEGKLLGSPLDLDAIAPEHLKGINWEGLGWFEPNRSLVVIHESSGSAPLLRSSSNCPTTGRRSRRPAALLDTSSNTRLSSISTALNRPARRMAGFPQGPESCS
jgi:hypothetical protein